MPLSSIVVIVLRLFAIQAILESVYEALAITSTLRLSSTGALGYLGAAGLLVFGLAEWLLAPLIARLVTRGRDSLVSIGGLTRADLYAFAFVFLGLYFILSAISAVLNALHFFFTLSATASQLESQSAFYKLAAPLVRMIAGFLALVFANGWASRLIRAEASRGGPNKALEPTGDRREK